MVLMAKKKIKRQTQTDSEYILKLVLYFILGSLWLHISVAETIIPLPVGFVVGLLFATHEHFRIDRKIEYAVLVVALLFGYFIAPNIQLSF
jgi:ABC-type dipeptide/oligopeptide/nickel transport system permease component